MNQREKLAWEQEKKREGGKITLWFFAKKTWSSAQGWASHIFDGKAKCENCGVTQLFNSIVELLEFLTCHKQHGES